MTTNIQNMITKDNRRLVQKKKKIHVAKQVFLAKKKYFNKLEHQYRNQEILYKTIRFKVIRCKQV